MPPVSASEPNTGLGVAPTAEVCVVPQLARRKLAARLEPFDSYWQAPQDVASGYRSFNAYYRANYLRHLPADRNARILVVSCGPGYLVNLLRGAGIHRVGGLRHRQGRRPAVPAPAGVLSLRHPHHVA